MLIFSIFIFRKRLIRLFWFFSGDNQYWLNIFWDNFSKFMWGSCVRSTSTGTLKSSKLSVISGWKIPFRYLIKIPDPISAPCKCVPLDNQGESWLSRHPSTRAPSSLLHHHLTNEDGWLFKQIWIFMIDDNPSDQCCRLHLLSVTICLKPANYSAPTFCTCFEVQLVQLISKTVFRLFGSGSVLDDAW